MSQADLNRLREDLETIRHAAGMGTPFGPADVRLSLAWAAAGVPVAIWVALQAVETWLLGALVVIPAGVVLLLTSRVSSKYHRDKARAPFRWREHRHQWLLAAAAVPLMGAFWLWGTHRDMSPETLTATAVFMAGLAYVIPAIVDRARLFYVGWAVPTMLLSIVGPLCGYRYIGIAVGGWLILSGLSAAAIMAWQLRTGVDDHAAD